MTNLEPIWQRAQTIIRERIGESSYQTWFLNLRAITKDPQCLVLETPDEFFKTWIEDHYLDVIRAALNGLGAENAAIRFQVNPCPDTVPAPAPVSTVTPAPNNSVSFKKTPGMNLQARFNFDTFVVGNSNRLAYAASRAVAENPAKAYNPFFLYGQTGLGKTHLMQSIANQVMQNKPGLHCLYLSSEQFTNELIEAIRYKSTSAFRNKYRNIDILLIDDIQFIAGKESTQEEFFHTFNALHDNHKQIVVSSDRPPREISNLEDRLVTRFTMGLISDIQPPAYETRVAILRKKVALENVQVPDDVIYFIAEQIKTNIRELEGAMIRVVACSILEDKIISLDAARAILKDMVKETLKTISIEMVQQSVVDFFKITSNDLKSKRRTRNLTLPRHVAMYLSRTLTRHSLPEIGNAFGGKDHTTVLHACKKIEEDIGKNPEIKYLIEKLTGILNQ